MRASVPELPAWALPALTVGVGIGVVYAVYKLIAGIGEKGKDAVDSVSQAIADVFTGDPPVAGAGVNARIIFPNGQTTSFAGINLIHEGGGRMTFMHGGKKYVLSARRSDGLYPATPA